MRIVFPESKNPIIQQAIEQCPEVKPVYAENIKAGVELVSHGEADAIVAGIDCPTREFILACKDTDLFDGKYFTSSFVMKKDDQTLILADCGVCKKINFEILTEIILQTYQTALKVLEETPKIAMLSFSTLGSGGNDESIDLIHDVLKNIHENYPEIIIDGEMQLDAAVNQRIANKKIPNSEVAGNANVLICPNLNTGNILYKGLEQLGGWTAAGPIMQGFKKPISDLSRGSSVEDVIETIKTIIKLGA